MHKRAPLPALDPAPPQPSNNAGDYLTKAAKQVFLGDYNKDGSNLLGTLGSVALSLTGWDLPIDLANLKKSLDDWDGSWGQTGNVVLSGVVLFPVLGILKNVDEVGDLAKGALKNSDELGGLTKSIDDAPNSRVYTGTDRPVDLNRLGSGATGPDGFPTARGAGGTFVTSNDLTDPDILPGFASDNIPFGSRPNMVAAIEVPTNGILKDPTGDIRPGNGWIAPNTPGARVVGEWNVDWGDLMSPPKITPR